MQYRPEIDGLRAVAILAVLFFHAQFVMNGHDFFSGGFIGVDVFFVISGYLISRIIFQNIFEYGHIKLFDFYVGRIRRIFPLVLVVVAATFPFAWTSLSQYDFISYSQSALASISFVSNIFFYIDTTVYGATNSLLKPLLNMWSLGVEIQFYVMFPLLILLLARFRHSSHFLMLLITTISCFFLTYLLSSSNKEMIFYHSIFRFWEFFVGALCGFYHQKYGRKKYCFTHDIICLIALFSIVASITLFAQSSLNIVIYTIIPVCASALLLLYASTQGYIGKVLSWPLLKWIGTISYSLYLWHFPIFAFARMNGMPLTLLDKVGAIILTFCLSCISYYVIERPFRSFSKIKNKTLFLCLFLSFIVLAVTHLSALFTKGFEQRFPPLFRLGSFAQSSTEKLFQNKKYCFDRDDNFCRIQNDPAGTWVQLIGDSHMGALEYDLINSLGSDYNYLSASKSGCFPIQNMSKYTKNNILFKNCDSEYQSRRLQALSEHENSIVVIVGRLPVHLSSHLFDNKEGGVEGKFSHTYKNLETNISVYEGVLKTINSLSREGHKIVLVYPIPEVGLSPMTALLHKKREVNGENLEQLINDFPVTTSYEVYKERTKESFSLLDSIQGDNIHRVYPHTLFCDDKIKDRCITHDREFIYYWDDDHPSKKGAELINKLIIEKIKKI